MPNRLPMRAAVMLSLLVTAMSWAGPAAAQTPVSLDRFLAGLERSCRQAADYQRFARSLVPQQNDRAVLGSRPNIPEALRAAFGRPTYRSEDDVGIVTVPVRGTFHGLPVRALRITRGHGSATFGDGVLLDVPLAEARRVLGPMIERSRRGLGEIEEIVFEENEGAVLLECFAAN